MLTFPCMAYTIAKRRDDRCTELPRLRLSSGRIRKTEGMATPTPAPPSYSYLKKPVLGTQNRDSPEKKCEPCFKGVQITAKQRMNRGESQLVLEIRQITDHFSKLHNSDDVPTARSKSQLVPIMIARWGTCPLLRRSFFSSKMVIITILECLVKRQERVSTSLLNV